MAHNWSGWPGAVCTKCGAEHALENALALNWFNLVGEDERNLREEWKSPAHKELVELCDNNCSADMSKEEFKKIQDKAAELGKIIEQSSGHSQEIVSPPASPEQQTTPQ